MIGLPIRRLDESPTLKTLGAILLCSVLCGAQAAEQQGSSELSGASELAAEGSALVVVGSLSLLAASGTAVVASVETAGDASVIVLAGASQAAEASVRLSGRAARGASLAVGASVEVVAISSGYLLVAAGKAIAFIPNEIGKALLHHSRVRGGA